MSPAWVSGRPKHGILTTSIGRSGIKQGGVSARGVNKRTVRILTVGGISVITLAKRASLQIY